ncbi:MAG: LCCL domain-containing protein [Parasphingorhabdus sp.]
MQMPIFRSIFSAIIFVSAALASPALAAPASPPTPTQKAQDIGVCAAPTSWAKTDKLLTCTCPAGFDISTSLWGTDIYTADSYICSTALHASVIDRSGGRVTIQMLPGQNNYAGTVRNGVSTRSYGAYTASYSFVKASVASSGGVDSREPVRPVDKIAGENIGECKGATRWRGTGKTLSCTCPANFSVNSPIWGSGIYTDDSFICKAALHAGKIGRSGGQVSIQMLPGQSSYTGSNRNGVSTLSYGSHSGSYQFN